MESSEIDTIPVQSANRQIARAAGSIMLVMVLNQVFSLVSSMLITRAFGTGAANDTFFASNKFADIIYNLVAGGALASAFIPTFTTLLAREDRMTAWKLASAVANWVTLILVIFTSLSAVFAPWLVKAVLAPGFAQDAQVLELTVRLLRIQLAAPVIFGISGLLMGIINSHQRFILPALAPCMYSLGKILGVLFLVPSMGVSGLALGVVIGAAMHGLIQLPALLRLPGRKYELTLGLKLPEVREVVRLMAPRLLGVASVQINFLVNTNLASPMQGAVSAISVAFALMLIPEAAIAQAMAIAALPTFSTQVAKGRLEDMRGSLAALLRGILLLALPATVGLVMLRKPLVMLIYQGGQFGESSTEMVTWALLWYAAGLVFHSIVEIVSRAFYALHDTKTPVFVGVAAMSLNVGMSFLFLSWFRSMGLMAFGGLALANTVATALESLALLIFMRKRLNGLEGSRLWNGTLVSALCSMIMGAALFGWLQLSHSAPVWLIGLGGILVGVIVYGVALLILHVPELTEALAGVKRFLNRQR
ncbi:MAG TPA: murein biosynthesis integral membrane protein MurJ [Anaerolineaceae bacterium]|nr:murein biosynthesis integral membrane protein MurJ [Anaerolineaceae bacterium]